MDDLSIERAKLDLQAASKLLMTPGRPGFGYEKKYAEAYQRLVNFGVRPQLKRKYRAQ